ncbi:hypothetical protein HanRHA438_Chr16g0753721 [Helianthus annuus]|nr:hypothetical protein HanRHA438_Chr16g0753721 [Helianthus annuus]
MGYSSCSSSTGLGKETSVQVVNTSCARGKSNGVVFSVSVEVKDFYLLPQEILFAVSERRKAQATGDNDRAREMMHKINATQDYEYCISTMRDIWPKSTRSS